ncbi:MAG: hypothetical protein NW217_14650 [Hyphomicrobiaceae bacterium]|nr:hypothetical protein [Hyphomicrobiaceae bacterium]
MRVVRVFLSSPSDVMTERRRAQRVIERLNGELAGRVRFDLIRWETRYYSAHAAFQDKIPEAKTCDIVLGLFWARLGSALPESFASLPESETGGRVEPYPSGSAYEILSSIFERGEREKRGEPGRPDVYVFRKTVPPLVAIGEPDKLIEAQRQWGDLERFFQRWFRTAQGEILRAFHLFDTSDDLERHIEDLLRDWIKANVTAAASIVWPITVKGSPFRGLAAFDARYAPVFFGRDRKIARAIELLKDAYEAGDQSAPASGPRDRQARPFLLIVGSSGSGKSSLMRAGLAPRLTAPGVVPAVEHWRVAVMRPGDGLTPLAVLADALLHDPGPIDETGFGAALPELSALRSATAQPLAEVLAADPDAATERILAALDEAGRVQGAREGYERALKAGLLILVDQLEDVFAAHVTAQMREAFADLLARLALTRRVFVVATLRGDLYEQFINERHWIVLKDSGATYDLLPPGPDEIEEIVRRSAAAAGIAYERHAVSGRTLDQQLIEDAGGSDTLPLLQFTLDRLFAARRDEAGVPTLTFAAYDELGGLDGAIEQAGEQAVASLPQEARDTLPKLLRLLAVPVTGAGKTGGSQLALTVRAVAFERARFGPHLSRLVDTLVANRVLLADKSDDGSSPLLRIAHQRVLESWSRARTLIEAQQDFFRIREDVEQQFRRWQVGRQRRQLLIPPGLALLDAERIARAYRDDLPPAVLTFIRASSRRARVRQSVFASLAIVFAAIAAVALLQWREADQARGEAVSSYRSAKGTVDQLIGTFTGRLALMQEVSLETIKTAFDEIKRSVDHLGEQAARSDPLFNETRADLALGFANTYKKRDDGRALELAHEALRLRLELAARFPTNLRFLWLVSKSHEFISDLERTSNIAAAEASVLEALKLRRGLAAAQPENAEFAEGLSKILVRLGDMQRAQKRFAEAARTYEEALTLALGWFLGRPTEATWQRELSWALSKVGTDRRHGPPSGWPEGLRMFEAELCLRRRLNENDPANKLVQADVTWSLERVAQMREALGDIDGASLAALEALRGRALLAARDPDDNDMLRYQYRSLRQAGQLAERAGQPRAALAYLIEADGLYQRLASRNAVPRDGPPPAPAIEKLLLAVAPQTRAEITEMAQALLAAHEAALLSRPAGVPPPTSSDCWETSLAAISEFDSHRGLTARNAKE